MNTDEAHQFIGRHRRTLYPWHQKTEAQASLGMQKVAMGLTLGMFGALVSEISAQRRHPDLAGGVVLGLIFLFYFGYSAWLAVTMHEARRILGYLPVENSKF